MGLSPGIYKDVGDLSSLSTDVIIIGVIAEMNSHYRDCALRGDDCILLELVRDIATGSPGRNHGLLHSGAHYAVNDQESTEGCIKETAFCAEIAHVIA